MELALNIQGIISQQVLIPHESGFSHAFGVAA